MFIFYIVADLKVDVHCKDNSSELEGAVGGVPICDSPPLTTRSNASSQGTAGGV